MQSFKLTDIRKKKIQTKLSKDIECFEDRFSRSINFVFIRIKIWISRLNSAGKFLQPLGSLRILILFRRTMVSFRRASQTKTMNVEKVQGLPRSSRRAISKELNIKIETVHVCRPLFAPVIPRSSSSLEYLLLSTIPVYPARGYPCSTFYSFTLLKKGKKKKKYTALFLKR